MNEVINVLPVLHICGKDFGIGLNFIYILYDVVDDVVD
jgi:hypothetical protein